MNMLHLAVACHLGAASLSTAARAAQITKDPGLKGSFPVFRKGTDRGPQPPGWIGFDTPLQRSQFRPGSSTPDARLGGSAGLPGAGGPTRTAVLRNADLGVGLVGPHSLVDLAFRAKGASEGGGVAFAGVLSEVTPSDSSASGILGGGPLALTEDNAPFQFQAGTGPEVSAGVTLQVAAIAGGGGDDVCELVIDDIPVEIRASVVPVPSALPLLSRAPGGPGLAARRRRSA